MRKYRPEIVIIRRPRDGRKRSRIQLGPRVFVFFLVAAILTGAVAIAVNVNLEDRWNRAMIQRGLMDPASLDRD